MTTTIIDGKAIATLIEGELSQRVNDLKVLGIVPKLVVVRVGEDPASVSYIRAKGKASQRVGIAFQELVLPETTDDETLANTVRGLSADPLVHGLLIQLPLPSHLHIEPLLELMDPAKDVDGFHPHNLGLLLRGSREGMVPCTPAGIIELLLRSGNDPAGKHCVIVGRSNLVGKPLANLLVQKRPGGNATVTVCHTGTSDLAIHTHQADILIVAVGRANTLTAKMIQAGAVVIDVGVNRIEDETARKGYRLVGDVDFSSVSKLAAAITPVPGGVGPLTVAMVVANTVQAAESIGRKKG